MVSLLSLIAHLEPNQHFRLAMDLFKRVGLEVEGWLPVSFCQERPGRERGLWGAGS